MDGPAAPPRYDEWLAFVFDRKERQWFFNRDFVGFQGTAAELVALVTTTLKCCGEDLLYFTEDEVADGVNYMFNNSCGDIVFAFADVSVPLGTRLEGIAAIRHLYFDCFETRCAPVLGHTDREGLHPLSGVCYMLWDTSPLGWFSHHPQIEALRGEVLAVMSDVLRQCHNPVCLESALHGLGHLVSACGTKAQAIIREFLDARGDSVSEALRAYAQAALTGCIL